MEMAFAEALCKTLGKFRSKSKESIQKFQLGQKAQWVSHLMDEHKDLISDTQHHVNPECSDAHMWCHEWARETGGSLARHYTLLNQWHSHSVRAVSKNTGFRWVIKTPNIPHTCTPICACTFKHTSLSMYIHIHVRTHTNKHLIDKHHGFFPFKLQTFLCGFKVFNFISLYDRHNNFSPS